MHPIGAAARLSGVNIETIRYYERDGVLPPALRSRSGRRLYDADGVARLRFVRRCRDLGIPLDDVRTLLALSDDRRACGDVKAIGERHLGEVRAKITDLRRLEAALVELIEPCDTLQSGCPALRTLFADQPAHTSPA